MAPYILILIRLLRIMFGSVSVISEGDNYATLYVEQRNTYVCIFEDSTYAYGVIHSVGIGADPLCITPDESDIDVWQYLQCDGQWEEDDDNTVNFYYRCNPRVITYHMPMIMQ